MIRDTAKIATIQRFSRFRPSAGQRMTQFRNLIDALYSAPPDRPFITHWIDEDEQEAVTFGEFRRRANSQADLLRGHGVAQAIVLSSSCRKGLLQWRYSPAR